MMMIKEDSDGNKWYNAAYVKEMCLRAEMKGLIRGKKIEFHAVSPQDDEQVQERITDFYNQIYSKIEQPDYRQEK